MREYTRQEQEAAAVAAKLIAAEGRTWASLTLRYEH